MHLEEKARSSSTDHEITGSPDLSLMENQVSWFHSRQSILIFLVFFVLVVILIFMTGQRYLSAEKYENAMIAREFHERVIYLDRLLSSVTGNVTKMRVLAQADLMQSEGGRALTQPLEFRGLKPVPAQNYYALDHFAPPVSEKMAGNLSGLGSLENQDPDFYREIHMALNLNPAFQGIFETSENVAWVYYTSKHQFINIYPWVSSRKFKYSDTLLTHEFYTLGLPENNKDRSGFWTRIYADEYGKGLMTTCAAPVYDRDRFLGTVAIDLTVDFLNTIVKNFTIPRGTLCLANDQRQLVAHPVAIISQNSRTKLLKEVLPPALNAPDFSLAGLPDEEIIRVKGYKIYSDHLKQAPWQMIYYEKQRPFWALLSDLVGWGPLVILAFSMILVVIVFFLTEKQFILPSKTFVNHIINRSRNKAPLSGIQVPNVWQTWFNIIDQVFTENENLTLRMAKQNEILDQQIRERTAELVKEVEAHKTAKAQKEILIEELQTALSEVKTLKGLIPICSACKKIRDDQGYWNTLEAYLQKYSEASFSHGLCTECMKKLYGNEDWYVKPEDE